MLTAIIMLTVFSTVLGMALVVACFGINNLRRDVTEMEKLLKEERETRDKAFDMVGELLKNSSETENTTDKINF